MMKLPASMNRHIVGVSAILTALVVLGYATNSWNFRRVASLPETGFAIAENASQEARSNDNFSTRLEKVPPNAYGSARGSEESLGQKITSGIKSMLPSTGSKPVQTESKNWNDEDWRIAEQAVADHRRAWKNSSNASAASNTVWQPPEEIATLRSNKSQ